MALHLSIITPDKTILDTDVTEVYLPGEKGEMGILPGHAPLISVLVPGELRFTTVNEGKTNYLVIGNGFIQVDNDKAVVVVDLALNADEIEETDFEKSIAKAKEKLNAEQQLDAEEAARFEATIMKNLAVIAFKRKHSAH